MITDDIPIPDVQPKAFSVTPSPKGSGQQSVHFADEAVSSPTSKSLIRSKSKSLGFSLRRITPDKNKSSSQPNLSSTPTNSPNDNMHSTTTGSSFVSRLTGRSGRSPKASSLRSMKTQQQRGAANNNNIERQQKMNDEYYQPTMRWADDESEEEEVEDGDLPSLKRVNSSGSGRALATSQWRAANEINYSGRGGGDDGNNDDVEGRRVVASSDPPSEAAAAAAAAAATLGGAATTNNRAGGRNGHVSQTPEELKVAGFWSQLDDNGTYSSDESDKKGIDYDDDDDGDDDDDSGDGEEMPLDEQNWRRSQSPPRNRTRSNNASGRMRFDNDLDANDADSIGLDLHPQNYNKGDDEEDAVRKSDGGRKWNLMEKAAYYNNEDHADHDDDDDDEEEDELGLEMDEYNEMEGTFEEDDQSLAQTHQTSHTEASGATGVTGGSNVAGTSGRIRETNTGQSSPRGRTKDGRTATATGNSGEEEETGVLACITLALTTWCGYEAATNDYDKHQASGETSPSSRSKRRIEALSAAALVSDGDDTSSDDQSGAEEEDLMEDAAIELEYHSEWGLSPPGSPASAASSAPGSPVSSPRFRKKKKKGLRKLLHLPSKREIIPENEQRQQQESPRKTLVTTTTQSGKQPLEKGGSKSRLTDHLSSLTFEQEILGDDDDAESPPESPGSAATENAEEEMEGGKYDDENNSVVTPTEQDQEAEQQGNNTGADGAADALAVGAAALAAKSSTSEPINNSSSLYDEEELESEAAAWTPNKKNSYLRQLADRAKMEYAAKAGTASAANDGGDDGGDDAAGLSNGGNSKSRSVGRSAMGIAAAAAVGVAAASSRSSAAREDDGTAAMEQDQVSTVNEAADDQQVYDETLRESTTGTSTIEPSSSQMSYNADYNSFSPTEKRQFLRLLNSGLSPQDAAQNIVLERSGDNGEIMDSDTAPAVVEEELEEEYEEDSDENELEEEDMYANDGPGKGLAVRTSSDPDDESNDMLSLILDPPGDTMQGASGESAELSTQFEQVVMEDQEEVASRSVMAQANSKSISRMGSIAAIAALPLVPAIAIVRAKRSRSKSKERKRQALQEEQEQDDDDEKDVQQQQEEDDTGQYLATPGADGLISSGIGYYDAHDRGIGPGNEANSNIDDGYIYSDSSLLGDNDEVTTSGSITRGRSRRGKLLGAAVASSLAAKVASRRHRDSFRGHQLSRGTKYKNVSSSVPALTIRDDSHIVAASYSSPVARDYEYEQRATKSDFATKSPKSLSSAFNFMNISKPINISKKGKSSKWGKLDSDLALDQVAPSRSAEVEGMPSWMLPRDDSETDEEEEKEETEEVEPSGDQAGRDEDGEGLSVDDAASESIVESTVQEQEDEEKEEGEEYEDESEAPVLSSASATHRANRPLNVGTSSPGMASKFTSKRNVVTPMASESTGNISDGYDIMSLQESTAESLALSPDDSLVLSPGSTVFSPGTLSSPSSQAYAMSEDEVISPEEPTITGVERHRQEQLIEEDEGGDEGSVDRAASAFPTIPSSSTESLVNRTSRDSMSAAPSRTDVSLTSPGEDAASLMSYATNTTGTGSWTTSSKSHRMHHKGAAPKRITKQVEFSPSLLSPAPPQADSPTSENYQQEKQHRQRDKVEGGEKEDEDSVRFTSSVKSSHPRPIPSSSAVSLPGDSRNDTAAASSPPIESPTSPDEDTASIMSYATGMTGTGSTWTAASKSQRKRHKGAASKRLQQAKQAENDNAGGKNKGWLDTIRNAASTQGQVWDPELGWVNYTEPEEVTYEHDYKPIGNLHLAIPSKRKSSPATSPSPVKAHLPVHNYVDHPEPVAFPEKWADERETMIKSDEQPASALQRTVIDSEGGEMKPGVLLDDESIFDATTTHTINTAVETSSVVSTSTAPTHRSAPRHRSNDWRKTSAAAAHHLDQKPTGWKKSMENATNHMMEMNDDSIGRRWEYEKGWVRSAPKHRSTDQRKIGVLHTGTTSDNKPVEWKEPTENVTAQTVARNRTAPRHRPTDQRKIGAAEVFSVAASNVSNDDEMPSAVPYDDSVNDMVTVHTISTTAKGSSIFSNSTAPMHRSAAPTHRSTDQRKTAAVAAHLSDNNSIGPKKLMENATAQMVETNNEGNGRHSAPIRRIKDRRKISQQHSEKKPLGWKESMENATVHMVNGDRLWDYEKGWVRANGAVDDDIVSELTRSALEPSPERDHAVKNNTASGHDTSFMAAEDSAAPSQHLPSVAEEMEELLDSKSEEEQKDDAVTSKVAKEGKDKTGGAKHNDVTLDNVPPQKRRIGLPSLMTADSGSDKENQESENDIPSTFAYEQYNDRKPRYDQKPPLPTKKRSLNQWLEKHVSDNSSAPPEPLDESADAVVSRESNDSSATATHSSHLLLSPPKLSPSNFSNTDPFFGVTDERKLSLSNLSNLDPFLGVTNDDNGGDSTPQTGEVQVTKEKFDDADSDLFETTNITESFEKAMGSNSDSLDSGRARQWEVQVVKENLDDTDSDLFEPSKITESFVNRICRNRVSCDDDGARQSLMKTSNSHDSHYGSTTISPPALSPIEPKHSLLIEKSGGGARPASSRVRELMSSAEKNTQAEQAESDAGDDSDVPQINKVTAVSDVSTARDLGQKPGPVSSSIIGKNSNKTSISGIRGRNYVKKDEEENHSSRNAPDSWIKSRNDLEKEEYSNSSSSKPAQAKPNVANLRSQFETKGKLPVEKEANPVFIPTKSSSENDVFFRSTAMGIKLKRGEDGLVRVVSVTESIPGSSIIRDGMIEPEDLVMEAAGVDLRSPITNSQWGEAVTVIRNAPRPMKFVVAGGPRRRNEETKPLVASQPPNPPPPAKYVIESRLSKSPEGQQVLESLSASRPYEHSQGASPSAIPPKKSKPSQASAGGVGGAASSSFGEDETSHRTKESLFKRVVASCASPSPSKSSADQHHDNGSQDVPMAHLQFLRTNPTIARVTSAASRRYPVFCGRPDTIFEEPDDDERETKGSRTKERSSSLPRAYGLGQSRSAASSMHDGSQTYDGSQTDDGSQTYDGSRTYLSQTATLSTFGGTKTITPISITSTNGSMGSGAGGGSGDNTAFLDKLALNPAVASKPVTQRRNGGANIATPKLGTESYRDHPSYHRSQGNDALGWPESDGPEYENDIDNASTYSSNMSHSSYHSNKKKKDTVRQAELLAAAKVEDMMNELHNADSDDQCEI